MRLSRTGLCGRPAGNLHYTGQHSGAWRRSVSCRSWMACRRGGLVIRSQAVVHLLEVGRQVPGTENPHHG